MLPAQQGFETGHGLVMHALLRLIDQPQLVARDRQTQIMLQHPAFTDRGAHRRLEEAIGVAAVGLGAVERGIGVAEQGLAIDGVVGANRDADAGRDAVGFRRVAGRTQRFQNGLGEPAGGFRVFHAGHQDGEFVAAEPRYHLTFAEHRGDARRHRLQHRVAGGMTEQIVDFLEPVEIEAEHGETFACRPGSRFPDRPAS